MVNMEKIFEIGNSYAGILIGKTDVIGVQYHVNIILWPMKLQLNSAGFQHSVSFHVFKAYVTFTIGY
tara:strand:+ start:2050 stop:2250 length:201 start_codon:yes stop_codon:yes gene_type:complete